MHCKPRMVGGGRQADIAGGHPAAGGNDDVAQGEILPSAADVPAGGDRFIHPDSVAVARRVLLQQDRVGPRWHDTAGEKAHDLAGTDLAREGVAGRGRTDHRQSGTETAVGGPQRIAIHG